MNAVPESGDVYESDSRTPIGASRTSVDDRYAHQPRPESRRRSTNITDEGFTVELAVGTAAQADESRAPGALESGTILSSRYRLEALIGRGGNSSVYRATDLHLDPSTERTTDRVAVKLSRDNPSGPPHRLQREFQAMRGLSHSGIARVYELQYEGGLWIMSMQLLPGQTLKAWMSGGCAYAQALKTIDSCCDALDYAHSRGVVHGDLNPTNVLVADDGTATLIDFGSSSIPGSRALLGADSAVATTPLYASPQVLAGESAEQRDDLFSLACLCYGVLSGGRHPYGGHPSFEDCRAKSAPTYVPAIPVELFEVIVRGLSVDRDRRPASVSAFRREIVEAEQCRRAKVSFPQPVKANRIKKVSSQPPILASGLTGRAPAIARLERGFFGTRRFKRVRLTAASLGVLMVAVAGAAVVLPRTGWTTSKRSEARRVPGRDLEATHAEMPSPALPPPTAVAALAPSFPAKAAAVPHDSSSISFTASIVHANARQSMVAITVQRVPANENQGAFVWRVERGNALPSRDYQRMGPQRVSFMEGQPARTLFIPLLSRATSRGLVGSRFFDVVLQPVAGGPSLGRFARITVVIDPAPTIWTATSELTTSTLR